jgi:peptidoglycan-associated lipoprotein
MERFDRRLSFAMARDCAENLDETMLNEIRLPGPGLRPETKRKGVHMSQNLRRNSLASLVILASFVAVTGCGKKAAAPPPPPPPTMSTAAPTATITASPSVVNPGDGVALTWHTTDANDVSIDGIGKVPSSGTQTVNPTSSTNYHLVARGDGGSADATTRVTVNTLSASSTSDNSNNMTDDATFRQNVADVFFDYDSYDITPQTQGVILKDAAFLNAHPSIKVVIGGYCDERGSTEYNLALGENRASAVKHALVSAGVGADRVRTVSYGKEKQFCTEHDESCWQQNRRGQFSIDR